MCIYIYIYVCIVIYLLIYLDCIRDKLYYEEDAHRKNSWNGIAVYDFLQEADDYIPETWNIHLLIMIQEMLRRA